MKFLIQEYLGGPLGNPSIEQVLSLWRQRDLWLRSDLSQKSFRADNELSIDAQALWCRFLERCSARPPKSSREGVERSLEAYNSGRAATEQVELGQLIAKQELLILEDRVANTYPQHELFSSSYEWALYIPSGSITVEEYAALAFICGKFFHYATKYDQYFVVSSLRREVSVEDAVLLAEISQRTGEENVFELWKKAVALKVAHIFIELISDRACQRLHKEISKELTSKSKQLGWKIDFQLECFSNKIEKDIREIEKYQTNQYYHPVSRLGELLYADFILRNSHQEIVSHYFECLAGGLVKSAAGAFSIAQTISALPPGRCLFSIMEQIRSFRPSLFPNLIKAGCRAECVYALLALPTVIYAPVGLPQFNLTEEWQQIQQWIRTTIISSFDESSIGDAVSLTIRDEAASDQTPTMAYDSWKYLFENDNDRTAIFYRDALNVLTTSHENIKPYIIYILQMLPILPLGHQREEIAEAIARKYLADVNDITSGRVGVYHLGRRARLLAELGRVLWRVPGRATWQAWVSLWDDVNLESYMRRAYETYNKIHSSEAAAFNVALSKILIAHVYNLSLYMAEEHSNEEVISALVVAIVRILNKDREISRELHRELGGGLGCRPLFSWMAASHAPSVFEAKPFFTLIGEALSAFPKSQEKFCQDFLRIDLTILELSQFAWGFSLAATIPDSLQMALNRGFSAWSELEFKWKGALGYIRDLTTALYESRQYDKAEQAARVIIEHFDKDSSAPLQQITDHAKILLAGCLFHLKKYRELFALDSSDYILQYSWQLRNLQALGHLYGGQVDIAITLLQKILEEDPNNVMAWANLGAAFLSKEQWSKVIAVAEDARKRLKAGVPSNLVRNEAIAQMNTGDFSSALRLLDSVPGDRSALALKQEMLKQLVPPRSSP